VFYLFRLIGNLYIRTDVPKDMIQLINS